MANRNPQTMLVLPTSGVVHSETTPGKTYHVQLPYCPCPDFAYRRANKGLDEMFCKHLVQFAAAVGGYHIPEQGLNRADAVTKLVSFGISRGRAATAVSIVEASVRPEAITLAPGVQVVVSYSDGEWFIHT